jgi:DNA-binding NarL/FixJ family response regulator
VGGDTVTTHTAAEVRDARRRIDAAVAASAAPDTPPGWKRPLSPHEARIVWLASCGLTDQQIADQLHRSPHTIKTHWERIARAVGHRRRVGIVGACFRAGVIR